MVLKELIKKQAFQACCKSIKKLPIIISLGGKE
jgi:hypothetical protein